MQSGRTVSFNRLGELQSAPPDTLALLPQEKKKKKKKQAGLVTMSFLNTTEHSTHHTVFKDNKGTIHLGGGK